jgi:protein-disulfide isomerase
MTAHVSPPSSSEVSNRVLAILLVIATVSVLGTAMYVYRTIHGANNVRPVISRRVPDWESYAVGGRRAGAANPLATVVEFADYECPSCRGLFPMVMNLVREHPDSVAVVFRNYPITALHPHAMGAATTAECAAQLGQFRLMQSLLYRKQDSIGMISWRGFARRANLDSAKFEKCMADSSIVATINQDMAEGDRLNIPGTPAFLINDSLYSGIHAGRQLDSIVMRAARRSRNGATH